MTINAGPIAKKSVYFSGKMHLAVFFVFAFVASVLGEEYTSKYDNIDLDAIIQNDRLLKNYVDCLLDRGKCSNDATELKKRINDALETGCEKCTEKQKGGLRRVIKHLSENKREWWNELLQKYDPDGVYRKKYESRIKEENFAI